MLKNEINSILFLWKGCSAGREGQPQALCSADLAWPNTFCFPYLFIYFRLPFYILAVKIIQPYTDFLTTFNHHFLFIKSNKFQNKDGNDEFNCRMLILIEISYNNNVNKIKDSDSFWTLSLY